MGSRKPLLLIAQFPVNKLAMITVCTGLFVATAPQALSDDATLWGLGAVAQSSQDGYVGIDRKNSLLPLLHVENRYLRFFGTTLEGKLPGLTFGDSNQMDFALVGDWDGSGYQSDDSRVFGGMDERKGGVWGGAKMDWETDVVNVSAQWLFDLSGNSEGQSFEVGLDRSWVVGQHFVLTPSLGASWYDSNYIDYYYGVRSDEVRAGRGEYHGEAGVSIDAGLQGVYQFNRQNAMMLDVKVTQLATEIEDSPLVDESTENRIQFGFIHYF